MKKKKSAKSRAERDWSVDRRGRGGKERTVAAALVELLSCLTWIILCFAAGWLNSWADTDEERRSPAAMRVREEGRMVEGESTEEELRSEEEGRREGKVG